MLLEYYEEKSQQHRMPVYVKAQLLSATQNTAISNYL